MNLGKGSGILVLCVEKCIFAVDNYITDGYEELSLKV